MQRNITSIHIASLALVLLATLGGCKKSCGSFEMLDEQKNECVCASPTALYSPYGDIRAGTWTPSPDGAYTAGWIVDDQILAVKNKAGAVAWATPFKTQRKALTWISNSEFVTVDHFYRYPGETSPNAHQESVVHIHDLRVNEKPIRTETVNGYIHVVQRDPDAIRGIIYASQCGEEPQHLTFH
jgi:hypothetical protein